VAHHDEEQWVRQARAGDRTAFAALVERYWSPVHRWLYGLTHSCHSAEDLTQETFLKAWTALPSLQGSASFRPWLFRIARNCLVDSRRGARATPMEPLPGAIPGAEPGPLATAVGRESLALVQKACDRLPVHLRSALLLWTQEGLTYPEIAEALEITEETARWRVCRARQLLLRQLGPHLDKKPSS
jgi:RNA polymerase sigma-70 factor, ECF subfamily